MATKGIFVLNSPGTIDSDYRGSVGVILKNLGNQDFEIKKGDRVCQIVFCEVPQIYLRKKEFDTNDTTRNDGGFGSTGLS